MTIAPAEADIARNEGERGTAVPVVGPISPYPRLDLNLVDAKPEPREQADVEEGPSRPSSVVETATAQFTGGEPDEERPERREGSLARFSAWLSARWNGAVGNMADVSFATGLLGSGLGQLSYWSTKFPFWLALSFALTFELAMVGISRRVRERRKNELPAGALHAIGWGAALGAAGWNLVHLSDPSVVVRFELINGGAPLFHGGPVVGASFATLAMLGFLIHEQSEKYHVEDALARKGRKVQRIGLARMVNYPGVSWRVWRTKVADPSVDVDAEFLRVLNGQRGEKVLAAVQAPAAPPAAAKPQAASKAGKASKAPAAPQGFRSRSPEELQKLVPAVAAFERDENGGQRAGFRRLIPRFSLTQADARELRRLADEAAGKLSG